MKKKIRIGVVINAIYSDYSASVIDGISKFCDENDCEQIVFSIMRGNNGSQYDFHYDSITTLINPNNVDVLIICSATLANFRSFEDFLSDIKHIPPMIKISLGLDVPGLPSVVVDSSQAVGKLVKHVINDHGRRKFILMHADENCYESNERVASFKKALKEEGVRFDEKKSFCGNFVLEHAYDILDQYLKKTKKRDFNAVFCCNDEMALGCIGCLEDHGIHVPEDVSVIGYDNVLDSFAQDFGISTIDQHIQEQAYQAAKMAVDQLNGNYSEGRLKIFKAVPVTRTSCGCARKTEKQKLKDMLSEKEFLKHKIHHKSSVQLYMLHYFLLESQEPVALEKLYNRLIYCFSLFDISAALMVLYQKPIYYKDKTTTFGLPEKAVVEMAYSVKKGIKNPRKNFNPSDNMIPEEFSEYLGHNQIVFPLFAENYQYGYFIMQIGQYEKIFYQTVFELISKEIVASIKITQSEKERASLKTKNITLEEYTSKLQELSRTDEMTKILNRRGFYEDAQAAIDRYTSIGKKGLVIYGDMDGLKSINDTFGHEAGDRAIKKESEILREIFRSTDIVGRLGGDEFAIFAPEMTKKDFAQIKKRLAAKCDEFNKKEVEPFILSMSIGCTEFNENENDLDKLLNKADQKLYVEKRAKKNKVK